MSWYDRSVEVIHEATRLLPAETPLAERIKVVDAAYSFGERAHFPYKMWLKARYAYLKNFGYQKRGDKQGLLPMFSPLERAKVKYDSQPAPEKTNG